MKTIFKLYTIELDTNYPDPAELVKEQIAADAEIFYQEDQSKLVARFVTTASVDEVGFMIDELKKRVEVQGAYRLRYKVTISS